MKKRVPAAIAVAAAVRVGVAGGMAIANGGSDRESARVVAGTPIVDVSNGPATKAKGKGPDIRTFVANQATVPTEGNGLVQGIKCPKKTPNAVGGGAQTSTGVVISYLSAVNPSTGKFKPSIYYIGVDDNSSTNQAGSGAFVEVQCSKSIKVG